jgi:hypothetical protein
MIAARAFSCPGVDRCASTAPLLSTKPFCFHGSLDFLGSGCCIWHAHSVHTKSPCCCHRYVAVTTRTVRFLSETDAQLQQTILSKLSAFLVGRLDFGGSDSVARGVYLDQLFRAARYGARADLS